MSFSMKKIQIINIACFTLAAYNNKVNHFVDIDTTKMF